MGTESGDVAQRKGVTGTRVVPSKHRPSLTPRDRLLLADLVEFRYLTTAQVARLHFGHVKVAQRRLRVLHDAGLVVRAPFQGGARAGFHEWTYAASPASRAEQPVSGHPVTRSLLQDPARGFRLRYAEHHRSLTDVRIWLREAVARTADEVRCRFLPGYAEMQSEGKRRRVAAIDVGALDGLLVPDGAFELSRDARTAALFFLEVDRGTEPLRGKHRSSVFRKLELYRKTYDAGLYAPFAEFFDYDFTGFRVAFVAPEEERLNRILEVAEAADLAPLVWVTTDAAMHQKGDLSAPAWRDSPKGHGRSLLE